MASDKSIEEMTLAELKDNVTEMSDEDLLAYLNGTRNNRMKAPVKKPKKKTASKKKKSGSTDKLEAMLAAMGPEALEMLAKMMEDQ